MTEHTTLPSASQALLSAALGGLLCLAAPGCSSGSTPASNDAATPALDGGHAAADSGKREAGKRGIDANTDRMAPDDATADVVLTNGDTPLPDTECDGGVSPDPTVTSSKVIPGMTQAQFEKECAAKGGIFEIQPHCGGSNACRGMSYDTETEKLIEHTCRATNSCGGYSCVVCS